MTEEDFDEAIKRSLKRLGMIAEDQETIPQIEDCTFTTYCDVWPGVGKLIEECGELTCELGKLICNEGDPAYWEGRDLLENIENEIADVMASSVFVITNCNLDKDKIEARIAEKIKLYDEWRDKGI